MSEELETFRKHVNKNFGKNTLISGDFITDRHATLLNICPILNLSLSGKISGGLETQQICRVAGAPKTGKTSLALSICGNAQQEHGMNIIYLNVEARLRPRDLLSIHNLNAEKVMVIESNKEKILSAQEYLHLALVALKTIPNSIIIIDSLSALCSAKEMLNEDMDRIMSEGPLIISSFLKQVMPILVAQNSLILSIQHTVANIGGYGAKTYVTGGNKIHYMSGNTIESKGTKPLTYQDKHLGMYTNWLISNNLLGTSGTTVTTALRYGYGLDDIKDYISLGVDAGIINKSGNAWFQADFLSDTKINGEENVRQILVDEPEKLEFLKTELKQIYEV
jgi:RecA/RadA recombinase